MVKRGCGIIFYNRQKKAVLVFRRDNKDWIPFPDMLDLLGGGVEDGESPEEAVAREMAEELFDLRTSSPYVLEGYKLFRAYVDRRGSTQFIFTREIDFEIQDIRLLEGKELVWLTKKELDSGLKLAFEFDEVLNHFFLEQKV